jgi:hypothetical protein
MMLTYRLKEAQFGLTDLEKNNYAFRFYKYYKKDASKYEAALKAYEEVYESPETVINNNLVSYMALIRTYQAETKAYDVKDLMKRRAQMAKVIQLKTSAGGDLKKLNRYNTAIENMFFQTVKPVLNCDAINELSQDAANQDIQYTKMIFSWALEFGCTDEDFFITIATALANDEQEGTPGIMKILAQRAAANGNYDESILWYTKSLCQWLRYTHWIKIKQRLVRLLLKLRI